NGFDDDQNGIADDIYGANFINTNGDVTDSNGHGTHVAGIIGAVGNNAIGVSGINWTTQIMSLKFIGANGGYTSDAIRAIQYAVKMGANIINASWGGPTEDANLRRAMDDAQRAGVIIVAAAGNDGNNTSNNRFYPAAYSTTMPNVVSVAAIGSNNQLASFSNYGTTTTLAAPGVSILSTLPNSSYASWSGTSMAAPQVAGALALLWNTRPTLSATQVVEKLKSSVEPTGSLVGKTVTGGRLNVRRLLDAPVTTPPPTTTTGARVLSAQFQGTAPGRFSSVRVTFNTAIQPGTFTIADVGLSGPTGAINATGVTAVSGSGNTQFDVTFATQTATGLYTLRLSEDIRTPAGAKLDQNADGVAGQVPADRFVASATLSVGTTPPTTPPAVPPPTATAPTTIAAGNVPQTIPDLGVASAWFDVNADLTIGALELRFSIAHSRTSDLQIRLVNPSGTAITLVNQRGGAGANFSNTRLTDSANGAVVFARAPFAGSYRPETLFGTFRGQPARGRWRLEVRDLAAGVVGQLTAAQLQITPQATNSQRIVAADFNTNPWPHLAKPWLAPARADHVVS
ncbi:MAG: S8 family serine peptidase, partial [Gemmataceae bacterium]